ncbi:MAG: hypothetical protein KIC98_06295 [Clostridioides difficile]|nr:hypothetical protein [Clostridioides difficile]
MNNIITLSVYLTLGFVCLITVYNYGRKLEQKIYSEQRKKFEQLSNENKKLKNDILKKQD